MPGIPAPSPLLNTINDVFKPASFPNNTQVLQNLYPAIQNLNTNPAAQYGNFQAYNNNLGGTGNTIANLYGPSWGAQAFTSGQPAFNQGQALYGQDTGAATGVLNNLFNNQQGLYNQLFNQNQQQANAENAMAGVATTPYGAALANQSGQNFNNAWQSFLNQQQNLGANTAATLQGQGLNALLGGTGALQGGMTQGGNILANLLGAGGNAISQGQTGRQAIDTQQFNALQGQIQDYLSYEGGGQLQDASAYINALQNLFTGGTNAAAINNQAQQFGQDLNARSLSGLGSLAGSLALLGLT